MTTLIENIGTLAGLHDPVLPIRGRSLAEIPVLNNAWLLIEDGFIAGFGSMSDDAIPKTAKKFSADGRLILPAWADSHTHLVFAVGREGESVDKIRGLGYAEIRERRRYIEFGCQAE